MDKAVGLVNPFNYCYGNSLIQQLYHIPCFRNDVVSLSSLPSNQTPSTTTSKKFDQPHKRELILQSITALSILFQRLESEESSQSIQQFYQSLIDTLDLKPSLHEEMRDVSEFFSEVIKLILLFTGKSLEISSPVLLIDEGKAGPFLQDHLGGEFLYTIQPDQTPVPDLKIQRTERFYYISLNLHLPSTQQSLLKPASASVKTPVDIADSLTTFFQSKSFNYKWKTPSSEITSLPSSQRIQLNLLSNNLIFYLRRFQFDFKTKQKEKVFQPFLFPRLLDMTPFISTPDLSTSESNSNIYRLNGLILHQGDDTDEGHYVSLVWCEEEESRIDLTRSRGDTWMLGSKWTLYDDERVKEVTVRYEDEIYDNNNDKSSAVEFFSLEEIEENVVMMFYIREPSEH